MSEVKKIATRESYGNALVELGKLHDDVVVLDADLAGATKTGMFNYCWPGCLTVMYDRKKIGLIQIADIKKNNDYAMWLKVCKKTRCYLLDEVLAEYRRGRSGSISTHGYKELIKWHYRLFRVAEKENAMLSLVNTIRNMMFGLYKKKRYVKESRK